MDEYKAKAPQAKASPADMEQQRQAQRRVAWLNREFERLSGRRKKAYILTFGCQQNEADSERIAGMCEQMGYEMTNDPQSPDLVVVNTCAIREHAEKKALSQIGGFKHLKENDPGVMIAVCGCMVAQEHRAEQIKHSYPYVDLVFSTGSIHLFPSLLLEKIEHGKRQFRTEPDAYGIAEGMPVRRESTYKAWVSIMYGCNNFCTYCIVPYVRGRERSRKMEEVVREVEELVRDGYRDITLLGQNVNSYGQRDGFGYDFADLVEQIDRIGGDFRLRFMTSHPKDASDKLIDVMARSSHVCHQFHLPLQSGSDRILRAMNRHYDWARYEHVVNYLRQKMPDVTLSTDIIVGFPGETEEDFEQTLRALEQVRYDLVFSFIYSPRRGTPAAKMEEQIPPDVQGARFRRLLEVQNAISLAANEAQVGQTLRVLCEGPSHSDPDVYSGRTEGNKLVLISGRGPEEGTFGTVRITRADPYSLFGEWEG